MSQRDEEAGLIAAIVASPDDDSRLVYADWLLARGDPLGELIVLEHLERTTPGGLTHPDQLASLLRLAAELGFPTLPDPDGALLAFEQLGRGAHYRMFHGGRRYTVVKQRDELSLAIDDRHPIYSDRFTLRGDWNDGETNVILTIVHDAITHGVPFDQVEFPDLVAIRRHAAYRPGPFPRYFCAEVVEDFERDWLLRARDLVRWYAIYDRLMAGFSATSHR